jgi:hypothetical protein
MENKGYLILQKPEELSRNFELEITERKIENYYKNLLDVFSSHNPNRYLGISREPLFGVPKNIQSEFEQILEPESQDYIWHLEEQNLCSEGLIFEYDEAIKAFKKIKNKDSYDIICVRNNSFENDANILGFDVGYWDGDHFSLIADTIVIPRWHPAPEEDFIELSTKLKSLNENLLFNTYQEAEKFKKYYKTKSWAETEDIEGEFCVIQVQKVFYLI